MGFFERNRAELAERGIDPGRLPPGQYHTERFPVLHVGDVPVYTDGAWDLRVTGLVEHELRIDADELHRLPSVEVVVDIHCVTKWSKLDTRWRGVPVADLLARAGVRPGATHVVAHAEHGYAANLPLDDVRRPDVLVAYDYDGAALEPVHGGPARLLVPHLYFWKSVKWLRALELVDGDRPGFWERNGYHNHGDPFREQRFTDD